MRNFLKLLPRALIEFCAIGIGAMTTAHAIASSPPLAWVEFKSSPGGKLVQIIGHAMAFEVVTDLDFSLAISRKTGGNASKTRQSGHFNLGAGDDKILSASAINLEDGDELVVELTLLSHGRILFKETLTCGPQTLSQTL